jgi:hypothetical protein
MQQQVVTQEIEHQWVSFFSPYALQRSQKLNFQRDP